MTMDELFKDWEAKGFASHKTHNGFVVKKRGINTGGRFISEQKLAEIKKENEEMIKSLRSFIARDDDFIKGAICGYSKEHYYAKDGIIYAKHGGKMVDIVSRA